MATPQPVNVDLGAVFAQATAGAHVRAEQTLELVGVRLVTWLQAFLKESAPPVRAGEGERTRRRGWWADVTGQLALAYSWEVRQVGPTTWGLVIINSAEYAEALEAKEGYFVLSGAFDTGTAEELLRAAFQEVFGLDVPLSGGPPAGGGGAAA